MKQGDCYTVLGGMTVKRGALQSFLLGKNDFLPLQGALNSLTAVAFAASTAARGAVPAARASVYAIT